MERVFAFYRLMHGPEGAQALLEALRSAAAASFAEPGCRSSRIWREADDSGDVLLAEEWDSTADLERHIRTPIFRRLLAVLELSRSRPEVLYVDGARLRGIEWIEEVMASASPSG
jgi:quinol monooxygenase YgiN